MEHVTAWTSITVTVILAVIGRLLTTKKDRDSKREDWLHINDGWATFTVTCQKPDMGTKEVSHVCWMLAVERGQDPSRDQTRAISWLRRRVAAVVLVTQGQSFDGNLTPAIVGLPFPRFGFRKGKLLDLRDTKLPLPPVEKPLLKFGGWGNELIVLRRIRQGRVITGTQYPQNEWIRDAYQELLEYFVDRGFVSRLGLGDTAQLKLTPAGQQHLKMLEATDKQYRSARNHPSLDDDPESPS